MFDIRIHVIPTANDDGTEAIPVTDVAIEGWLKVANDAYAMAGIRFLYDPATDREVRRNSTLLNHDSTIAPGTNLNVPESQKPKEDGTLHNKERNRVAQQYPGKLVIFYSSGNALFYNSALGRWEHRAPGGGGWSGYDVEFVRMAFNASGATDTVAHEVGHYFALAHTHYELKTKTVEKVIQRIKHYVENLEGTLATGDRAFDFDYGITIPGLPDVRDTPPDPMPEVWADAGLDQCNPAHHSLTVDVPLTLGDEPILKKYTFEPDRSNVMGYWDTRCRGGNPRLSPHQIARVRATLETGKRHHLIAPRVLFDAVLETPSRGGSSVLGWASTDFAKQFDAQQKAGSHVVHMQAYVMAPGVARWNGVWEPGQRNQTRAIGWTHGDFLERNKTEVKTRHLTHLQAFNMEGAASGLRYDAVWEPGTIGQSTAFGWTFADIVTRVTSELANDQHITHLQASSLDGTVAGLRYDAIFEPGGTGQTFVIGWARADFNKHNDTERNNGRRLVGMQSYDAGDGNYLYDAVWEPGNPLNQSVATGWAFADLIKRSTDEASNGRGITHLQAQPLPGDQLRWDAIFAKISGTQKRLIGLDFGDMNRLLTASGSGRHITHLQAYLTA